MSNIQLTNDVKIDGNSIQAIDLLWTNANPTTSFSAQTINIDISQYDYFGVILLRNKDYINNQTPMIIAKRNKTYYIEDLIGGYLVERSMSSTNNSIIFGDSSRLGTYPNGTRTNDNTKQVPYEIYGIKTSTKDLTS